MANMNNLTGSLISLFNDSTKLARPKSDYNGSFFFSQNQEIVFRNSAPKGQVQAGETSNDQFSFGTKQKRSKLYNVPIDFFTVNNYVDDEGNKNAELINRYFELMEDVVLEYREYGPFVLTEIADVIPPQRAEDIGNNVWVARKNFVFEARK